MRAPISRRDIIWVEKKRRLRRSHYVAAALLRLLGGDARFSTYVASLPGRVGSRNEPKGWMMARGFCGFSNADLSGFFDSCTETISEVTPLPATGFAQKTRNPSRERGTGVREPRRPHRKMVRGSGRIFKRRFARFCPHAKTQRPKALRLKGCPQPN